MPTKKSFVYIFVLVVVILFYKSAWAIYPPEPQSGGRFFPGKGTRAAGEYSDSNYIEPLNYGSYTKTESGNFDRHHYAKGLDFGVVEVRPTVGYTGEYDSNIFLTEHGRKSDYINKLVAGADGDVVMEGGKYILTGGILSKSEWFASHTDQNHTDWSYQLGGEVHLSAIDLTVHDEFRDTTDRNDSELTARIKRYENRLGGVATIPFGEFFSETEVSDFILDFRDNNAYEPFNRHEFSIYPRIGMNIGGKTQALLEYGYTDINYENQDDRGGTAHQAQVGMRGFLGDADLVAYQVWGGWQFRHYDNGDLHTFNSFIGHGEMTYKMNPTTQFILRGIRRPEESIDAGQTFYTRNEVSLQLRKQVAEQWYVNGRGGVGLNHYSNDRLDFVWEPGAGVEYVLPGKVLAVFAEYKYSGRESDAGNRGYSRHIGDFGIKAEV